MRRVVHSVCSVLLVPLAIIAGAVLLAGDPAAAAERHVITTPNADYTGFDYQTLQDVDLQACEIACLGDAACRAFTFNTKAGWCFLKSDFGDLAATRDAIAGRVVTSAELTPSLERQRQAELDFLPADELDAARALVGALSRRYATTGASWDALRSAGQAAFGRGQYDNAAMSYGAALALAPEDEAVWADYAAASLAREPDSYSERRQANEDATAAAINDYLRSETLAERANALSLLADTLAKREMWKPAIRAYRASLAINNDEAVRAVYDRTVAEHGFRIVGHEVEADDAAPQICIQFSDRLPVSRPDLADYVTVDHGAGLAIEPQEQQICIDGVRHGQRYTVRVRAGLPAADGETLPFPVALDIYIRDRSPWVGFSGNAYVLPAGQGASIPLVSVNTETAKATIYRIGDRSVAEAIRSGRFLSQLNNWTADQIADQTGEIVWEGEIGIESKLNETVTTAIPIADAVAEMEPGAYVITAAPETERDNWGPIATQWFVVTDLALTTLSGEDGVHTLVRSLSTAEPVAGVAVRLVAINNDVLGTGTTDADGYFRFEPGLARGTGGAAPQMVVAETDSDYAFIDLRRAAFDLTDRGVEGRPAPGALDAFLTPERGIYRPGETIHLTALLRDSRAIAVDGLPLTLVVERPDGVEFLSETFSDQGLGGYSADVVLQDEAMRGSWRIKLYADPDGDSLAETSVLVEDFEPERLAFDLTTAAAAFESTTEAIVDLDARYLYGAPAPDLVVEGEIVLKPGDTLAGYPGYHFGLAEESIEPRRDLLDIEAVTDADGQASFGVAISDLPTSTKPFDADLIVRLADTNGRAVERTLSLPVEAQAPMIGIKPLFDDEIGEGANASFDVIMAAPDGSRMAQAGVPWKLERLVTDYQWYNTNGRWNYEVITTAARVATGTVDMSADDPARIEAPVEWGEYRLTVEYDGAEPAASSVDFYAGWYRAVSTSDTPDVLRVALDKPAYSIGDTAKLRLDPRFPGIALITVIDDRLIAMKAVDVPEDGTTVDLEITDAWGPGAYVTAALYRPMDIEAKRMPARALGITWAKVAPGDRDLDVTLGVADEIRPRGPMTVPVTIANLAPNEDAYVTVAAVDVGILNLTNFQTPAPDDWYFGQRRLGMEIRDVYGLLIDRMQGVPGVVRSGGDGGPVRLQSPPPTQKLLAFYSGILKVGADGTASVTFDLPEFNGTVRVMAMAWSKDGVGHAAKDVLVRDPVVVTSSIPRFLAIGDRSRLLVEIANVSGPAGDYELAIGLGDDLEADASDLDQTLTLAEDERVAVNIPIAATAIGDSAIDINLVGPNGEEWPSALTLGVTPAASPVTRRNVVAVADHGSLTVDDAMLAEFVPGTGSVAISLGGAGPLDVAGIMAALDRYPYGCAEQLTSKALPLVYLDEVALSVGIASDAAVRERVQQAIAGVLADQAASGAFGLWGPADAGGDLWLDAYVTDFLTRAADKGYDVPEIARSLALDNLSNQLAYAGDFSNGGEDIAYALYVLARTGRAAIGDLRYYTDSKLADFATPLAKAQIGAAMALYGDRQRAGRAFAAAMDQLDAGERRDVWRADYGSALRDQAAVLTLAAETETDTVDLSTLATRLAATERRRRGTSTQEKAWMLLAASALIRDSADLSFSVNGAAIAGALYRRFSGDEINAQPIVIDNLSEEPLDAVVAVTGVPFVPEPAGGEGFRIERDFYTPDGELADIATVGQNDRFVVVLTVTSDEDLAGRTLIVDPIPAGFEIENPDISASGDTRAYPWLSTDVAAHTEARSDRFVAAFNRDEGDKLQLTVAYSVRAVSPGVFAHPAATVEDMYRVERNARTDAGTVEVVGPIR